MSKSINISIKSSYSAAGVKAAASDMQRLSAAARAMGQSLGGVASSIPSQALKQWTTASTNAAQASTRAGAAAKASGSGFMQIGQQATKAERSLLQFAQAEARLQAAHGNSAGAARTLSQALGKVDQVTIQAIRAQTQLASVQKGDLFDRLKSSAMGAVTALGAVGLALAGLRSIASSVGAVADTEETLNVFQATAGATADEMAQVSAKATALGADLTLPATSANTAAQAMLELNKAGLTVNESMAAAKGTLQLAAAGALAEAQAAEYTAAALNQFGLAGREAASVADLYAAAANASAVDVKDVADSVSQAGAVFASAQEPVVGAKQALIDFTTAVALLGNAGIKGSDAGTSIKQSLLQLQAPSEKAKGLMQDLARRIGETGDVAYTAQGQMRSYPEILDMVRRSTAGMTEEMRAYNVTTIFGADASKALLPLLRQGADGWAQMQAKVTAAGSAQALAAARMQGLNGAVASFQSQVETLAQAGLQPLLPLMAGIVNGAANLAASLQGPVSAGALALASGLQNVGTMISTLALPAVNGLAMALAAYAVVQAGQVIPAILASIPALAAQTSAFITNAAAVAAAAGPYVLIAAAIAAISISYQDFEQKISDATTTLLNSKQWWADSATALTQYDAAAQIAGDSQLQLSQKTTSAAATVKALREQIEGEVKSLGERRTAGMLSDAQYQAELASINQHKEGLKQATAYLTELTQAEMQQITAGMDATHAMEAAAAGVGTLGDAANLTTDDIENLNKLLTETYQKGAEALGKYISTEVDFQSQVESLRSEHGSKLAALAEERGQAETDAARKAIDEKIAAEQEGYQKELSAQADAYSQMQAQQQSMLGQQLINYISTQAQLGNIAKDRAAALVEGVRSEFGVMEDTTTATFLRMAGAVDEFGNNSAVSVADATGAMTGLRDNAVETQQKMDALAKDYKIAIVADFDKGLIDADQMAEKLRAIPARVQADVTTTAPTAQEQVAELNRELGIVPHAVQSQITTNAAQARAEIALVTGALAGIPRNVSTTITTNRVETISSGGIRRASGGFVSGPGSATSDSIPAQLSNGEFVVRASQAQRYGSLLQAINGGGQGFATGGAVGGMPAGVSTGGVGSGSRFLSGGLPSGVSVSPMPAEAIAAQQAVNAKMLDDQKSYLDDALKLAADYQQQRLEIEKKFQTDLGKQIQENNVSKYESRADFYDNLTSATKDIGQEQAQQLAAQYEEWYAKARDAEQRGQADLAKQYEDFGNKRVAADLEYQKKVAEIKQGGVTKDEQAELDRMATIKQMRDQAAQAELSNIEQNGDKITNARDEALSQSDQAYAERTAELEQRTAEAFAKHADAATSASGTVVSAVDAETRAVADLRSALNSLPSQKTVNVTVSRSESDSSGGGGAVPPGGSTTNNSSANSTGSGSTTNGMATRGKTAFGGSAARASSAPDNAQEIVSQAAAILDILGRNANRKLIYQLKEYRLALDEAGLILANAATMARTFAKPLPPIDPEAARALANDMQTVVEIFNGTVRKDVFHFEQLAKSYKDLSSNALSVLKDVADFRQNINVKEMAPLDIATIHELAGQAQQINREVAQVLVPYAAGVAGQLGQWHDALQSQFGIIQSVAELRRNLGDPTPPLDVALLESLAADTQRVGAIIGGVLAPIAERDLQDLDRYATATKQNVDILSALQSLRQSVGTPVPPINLDYIRQLAAESLQVGGIVGGVMVPVAEKDLAALQDYGTAVRGAVDVLSAVLSLRRDMQQSASPLDLKLIERLAQDARLVSMAVLGSLVPFSEQAHALLIQWQTTVGAAVSALKDTAALRKDAQGAESPLDLKTIERLAIDARLVAMAVLGTMVPFSEQAAAGMAQWQDTVGAGVSVLKDVADLRNAVADVGYPLDVRMLERMAREAALVTNLVRAQLVPTSDEQATALDQWASATGSSVSILKDVAGLGRDLQSPAPPVRRDMVQRLARDAQDVTRILNGAVVPVTEEQSAALGRWQQATGASVDIASKTLGLTSQLFTDYQSPTDAQLSMIAADARRVVAAVTKAAGTWSDEGLASAKAYSDALGSTFGAFKDGLLFFDALKSGDFSLNPTSLSQFESQAMQALAVAGRLEAVAQTAGSTALTATFSGLNTAAGTLRGLADVPVSAALANVPSGRGGGSITANFYITPADGADPQAIADIAVRRLNDLVRNYA